MTNVALVAIACGIIIGLGALGACLGILNDRKRTLFAIGNDGGSTGASGRFNGLALLGSHSKSLLALVGCGQAVSNLLLPLFNRVNQRWPDVLHGDPSTKEEHDHLYKQRGINVHC